MIDLEFRNLLGHGRVWALVLTLVATALIVPARAEASRRSGGAPPHAAMAQVRHHATAPRRPHATAHSRRHARAHLRRHTTAPLRPHATAALRPHVAALVPDTPPPVSGGAAATRIRGAQHRASPATRHRGARAVRHRASRAARHRGSPAGPESLARPVGLDRPRPALIVRRYEPPLTFSPAAGSGGAPRSAAHSHPWHRVDTHVTAGRRPIIGPRREREAVALASFVVAMATIISPESSSLPPGGAEGFATGAGGASPGAVASAVLALAGVALLTALLPGLLPLDVLPWRSAVLTLGLERPG